MSATLQNPAMRCGGAWRGLLGILLAAGCCGTTGPAVEAAARDNVGAWGLALEYVTLWGRADSAEALAARTTATQRITAWGAQADAIVAGLTGDQSYDIAERLRAWEARATALPGAAGPGPAPAPAGAGGGP